MAKLSLVEIVQDVMSDMSSDVVGSIGDTAEAERVAAIAKSTFFKIMEERNWPHLGNMVLLDALANAAQPTHMLIPTGVRRVEWIKYDKKILATDASRISEVEYKHPKEFMELLNSRASTATNILVVGDSSGAQLNIRNDMAPSYWTSFDDVHIVFDSYNAALESSLITAKTQCFGYKGPVWGGAFTLHAVSTAYVVDSLIAVTDAASGIVYYYRCVVGGTTAAVIPAYSTLAGALVVDGTATFITSGTSSLDAYVPELPAQMFPMYLSQVKAQCFNKIKQVVDSQEERDAKRQRVIMQTQHHKNRQDGQKQKYGYGRR